MDDRTEAVLSVLCELEATPSRQTVRSAEIAEYLELSPKQVGSEMRVLFEQGYVDKMGSSTPTRWDLFPDGHPDVPEGVLAAPLDAEETETTG